MDDDPTIERRIDIAAPIDVVWRTITEPEMITLWLSDGADVEARPGHAGSLTFGADRSTPYVVGMTVVAVDRPHLFSFRWVHPPEEQATAGNSSLVTFTLAAAGEDRTTLRVVETGVEEMDLTEDERETFRQQHRHGWQEKGDALRDLLAAGRLPAR